MYTVQEIINVIQANPVGFSIAGIMVYLIGFLQYFTSISLQVREHKCPWWFWQHAWYIGHDLVFVLCFDVWFNQIDFWLFKVLWVGCILFIGIEIWTLFNTIKHDEERQEVFGRYTKMPVTKKQAWIRGLFGYALGIFLFFVIRIAIGDPCCLALMMSTNFIVAVAPAFLAEERGSRQGHSMWLGIFVIAGTIFTFSPQGIGFWSTAAECFRQPWFYAMGVVALIGAVRYLYVLHKMPPKGILPNGKKPIW